MYLNHYIKKKQKKFIIQEHIKKSLYMIAILGLFMLNVSSDVINEEWDNHTASWLMSLQNADGGFGYSPLSVDDFQPSDLATYYAVGTLYLLNAPPLKNESCTEWLKLELNESHKENRSGIFSDYTSIITIKKLNPGEKIGIDFTNWVSDYQCNEGYFFSDCNLTEDVNAHISETRDAVCLLKAVNYSKSLNKTLNWLISVIQKNNSFDSLGMSSFLIDSYECSGLNISSHVNTTEVIDWTLSQQNDDGSFGDGNIDDTYFAMNILNSLNCTSEKCSIAIKNAISFFISLQNPDGGFYAPGWNFNKSDMASTYVAVNALNLFNTNPKNTAKCISWILSHENQKIKCFVPDRDLSSTPQVTYFIMEFLYKAGEHPKDIDKYHNWLKSQTLNCDNSEALADTSYIIQMLTNSELENKRQEMRDCIEGINKNSNQFKPIDVYYASIILNNTKNQMSSTDNFDMIKYNLKSRIISQDVNNFQETYYSIMAHNYLGFSINQADKEKYLKYIKSIENYDGGFGSMNYSKLIETHAAIEALHALNESQINVNKTISWILSCKKEKGFSMAPGAVGDLFHSADPVATSLAISSLDILSDDINPEYEYGKNSIMPILIIVLLIIFVTVTIFLIRRGSIKNNLAFGIFVGLITSIITIFIAPTTAFFALDIENAQLPIDVCGYLVIISIIVFLSIITYAWLKRYKSFANGMILGYFFMFIITAFLVFISSV